MVSSAYLTILGNFLLVSRFVWQFVHRYWFSLEMKRAQKEGDRDRQTDRRTDRQTDRYTDRQKQRQRLMRDRQIDGHMTRETNR